MKWSKQEIYCNNCGKKLFVEFRYPHLYQKKDFSCCSQECKDAIDLKDVKSLLGEE